MGNVVSCNGGIWIYRGNCDAPGDAEAEADSISKGAHRCQLVSIGGWEGAEERLKEDCSMSINFIFQLNPAEKPPSLWLAASTRWQGTRTGMGLAPQAPPTARRAL